MPTYEYRCERGHEFERFQKMSDDPISTCPECGTGAERILSGGAGFVFKGEGFYATDYRSSEYREKKKKEKKATGADDGDSAGSSSDAADAGAAASSTDASSSTSSDDE